MDNPLIVHVADPLDVRRIVKDIPEVAAQLMAAFWPGPLTLLLEKADHIPEVTSAGLSTIGVRVPSHPIAQALLALTGPVAAPSANLSGKPSPTEYHHVAEDLMGRVDAIIEGVGAVHGIESTVFHVATRTILRPGSVTQAMIEDVIGQVGLDPYLEQQRAYLHDPVALSAVDKPLAPGQKYKHYAPKALAYVVVTADKVATILAHVAGAPDKAVVGILATDETLETYRQHQQEVTVLSMGSKANGYAQLFGQLREFDQRGIQTIYIQGLDETGIGFSVMDRMMKAASYQLIRR